MSSYPQSRISQASRKRTSAFTLIELLTVIAIIGVLAGILIAAIQGVRKRASAAHSVSNLRQLGSTMNMYANDHKDRYPGPVNSGQSPKFRPNKENNPTGNLAYYIRDYIGEGFNANGYAEIFTYPGWVANTSNENGISYFVHREPFPGVFPLGRLSSNPNNLADTITRMQLSRYDLSKEIWISEADQENQDIPSAAGWFSDLPERAVHGSTRNVLYYDGSVAALPANEKTSD